MAESPRPSSSTSTVMSVSLVTRLMKPLRMHFPALVGAFYQGCTLFATAPICAFASQCLDHVLARKAPMQSPLSDSWHGTTILTVRKNGSVVIGGDGQVTIGQTIVKANAKKVRRLGKGDVIGGFAGATADAFTLFERLEAKLEQ